MKKYAAIALVVTLFAGGLISYNAYAGLSPKAEVLPKLKLEKELNPNSEKELDEAIVGLETALEISEKEYNIPPVKQKGLAIIKEKQAMLMELKMNKAAKVKNVDQLLADLHKIRSIKESE